MMSALTSSDSPWCLGHSRERFTNAKFLNTHNALDHYSLVWHDRLGPRHSKAVTVVLDDKQTCSFTNHCTRVWDNGADARRFYFN